MKSEQPTMTSADPSAELSMRVVEVVAEADGVDPAQLDPTLHTVIDPEALDRLFATTSGGARRGSVTFSYRGHTVTVRSDGTVELS